MNNLRKRIFSLCMSGVMTLSMAAPFTALAEGPATVTGQDQGASPAVQEAGTVPNTAHPEQDASALPEEDASESPAPEQEAPAESAPVPENEKTASAGEEVQPEQAETDSLQVSAEEGVAQIGNTYYATFPEAVSAATAGQTVTLLQDVQLDEAITTHQDLTVVAESGSTITLSRAEGYTGALFNQTGGTLTIGESESDNAGFLVLDGGAHWLVDEVVTDDEGRAVLNAQGEEEKRTVDAESPAVPEAYDEKGAATAALITVTKGDLYVQQTATLQNNHSSADGGAVATTSGGNAKIHLYGTFTGNATDGNGGVYSGNSYLTVYDTASLTGNYAAGDGGAVYLYGGGVANSIQGEFTGNAAGGNGGALWLDGKTLIEGGNFTQNRAAKGGALYAGVSYESRAVQIDGGSFTGNTAQTGADAVLAPDESPSDYGWTTISGAATFEDAYLGFGKYLAVAGKLSGSVKLSVGGTLANNQEVARGNGYLLKQSDMEHLALHSTSFGLKFESNAAKLQKLPGITITAQPQAIESVGLGETATLTVETPVEGTAYQWYLCSDANGAEARAIPDATSASYTVPTGEAGSGYYYCTLTAKGYAETRSDVVLVKVVNLSAAAPVLITRQPQGGEWGLGKKVSLTVEAKTDGGSASSELSYQWYASDTENGSFAEVENGNAATLTFVSETPVERWFYCVVTNTEADKDPATTTAQTQTVQVRVLEAQASFNGMAYATLDEAVEALNASSAKEKTLVVLGDSTLSKTISLSSGTLKISADEETVTVTRAPGFQSGALLRVSGGELTIENVKLDGGAAWSGNAHPYLLRGTSTQNNVSAPLLNLTGGKVTLGQGSALQNNANPSGAGGINMSGGTLILAGGSLLDCYGGSHGGALYATGSGSTILLQDGEIKGNQAKTSSGGLCVDSGAKLTIEGGTIRNNYTVGRAGGLFINGTFVMTGGQIIDNRADGANNNGGGGGIVHNNGSFTLSGDARIEGNSTGTTGGGIASFGGQLTLAGGTITGNTAKNGGGVYKNTQQTSGSIEVTGGSITGNSGDADVVVTQAVTLGDTIDPRYMGSCSFEHSVTVRFDGNGAASPDSVTFHFLERFGDKLPAAPVRNGYRFLGWFTEAEGGKAMTAQSPMTFRADATLYAHWENSATETITLSEVSQSGTYYIEETPALSLKASGTNNLAYQWYQCADAEGTSPRPVEDGKADTLALPTDLQAMGLYYYYCVVSGDDAVDAKTDVIAVKLLSRNHAMAPQITEEPQSADLFVGDDVNLSVAASVVDDGTVTYQWYRADNEEASGTPIDGATGPEYCFPASEAEDSYYYALILNEIKGYQPGMTTSARAHVVVHNRITVSDVAENDPIMSADYWHNHRVGTAENEDGYIAETSSRHGQWSATNSLDKAFDGNWDTFWETSKAANDNAIDMTFSKPVTLDRILYSARRTQAGKGYPTRLTVYGIHEGEEDYREIGVAVSSLKTGYVLFTLPESVTLKALRFEFNESQYSAQPNWASAAELVLLRDEAAVLTGKAEISGIAAPGATLTVTAAAGEGQAVDNWEYQWQSSTDGKNFTDIAEATGAAYTVQEEDKDLYLRAVARDASGHYIGTLLSDVYRGLFTVTLEGDPRVGSVANAVLQYASGEDLTLRYQWQVGDAAEGEFTNIPDEIQPMLEIPSLATNKYIRAQVSVTPAGGETTTVASAPVHIGVTALMYGPPAVDVTLRAGLQGSSDENFTCRWQRGSSANGEFTDIDGAAATKYTLTGDDLNKYIRVQITTGNETLTSEAWQVYAKGTFPEDLVNFDSDVLYVSDLNDSYCLITNGGDGRPMRIDKNYAGGNLALRVNGQIKYFLKGFGGLSSSSIVYNVMNYVKYYHLDRFIARVGVDAIQDHDGNTDGAIFTVAAATRGSDGFLQWTTLQQTPVLRKTSESVAVDVMVPENILNIRIMTQLSGKSAYVYTDMADFKLVTADYEEAESDQQVFLPVEEYDLRIQELVASHKGMDYAQMLEEDQELRKLVYQRALVNDAGYSLLEALMHTEDTAKTLEWLFNDQTALEMFVGGGAPDGAYGRAIQALANLYTQRGEDLTAANANSNLYLRMMMALALTHSNDVTFWVDISQVSNASNVVERYDIYKRMHANGLLVKAFDTLNVEEMRMVMNNIIDNNEIEWLNWYNRKISYGTVDPNAVDITPNNMKGGPYTYIRYTFGYNYSRPQYFAEDRKAGWQEKYGLTYDAMQPQDKLDIYKNIDVLYQSGHPKLWAVFEEGAVCGGISKTGTNLLGVYGIPAGVVGQPGHAAYLRYVYTDEANGIARYDIYNDIFGWPESARGERLPCGWGTQNWGSPNRVSYINMAQDALNDEANYFTAQRLNLLADSFNNEGSRDTQAAIYEAALSAQSYHFDTWVDMVQMYENQDKTSSDYLALAGRISSALSYYPLPMYDLLEKRIKPHLSGTAEISSLTAYENAALKTALTATTANTSNPNAAIRMANYLMGNHDFTVATFSFDGEKAGTIVLSDAYANGGNELLYSLDGGSHWENAGSVQEVKLSEKQLASITAEKDILVRLQGTDNYYTIDITQPGSAPKVNVNDHEQRLISTAANLEWKTVDSTVWKPFSEQERFGENTEVTVREAAHGTQLPGPEKTYTIGKSSSTDERRYIYLENVRLADYSSAEDGKSGAAAHCIDGNIDTIWHTLWSGTDNQRYVTLELTDGAHFISAVEYMPSQGASANGRILKCNVYTSMTGEDEDWTLAGTATWANNANRKSINFTPVYAKYVKIVAVQGVNNYAAASMFELFEDTTVGNSTVTSIELQSAPTKTEYVVGEELDLSGMVVTATFEDKSGNTTSGPLNLSRLQFSPMVMTTAGEQTITATVPGTEISLHFTVNVSANEKQPNKLVVTQMPDKTRYFGGESLDTTGAIITAEYPDGTQARVFDSDIDLGVIWSAGTLTAGEKAGEQTITVSYKEITTTFPVEVSPRVASISVTKQPDNAFYSLGDAFDPTGMEVSAIYENGQSDVLGVADYTIQSDHFSNTAGTKELTVSYNRGEGLAEGGNADAIFTVTVYPYITAGGLQFEALDNTDQCAVTGVEAGYQPENGVVTIPETVETAGLTFQVVGIGVSSADGTGAFSNREDIERIILPATITYIQDGAFADCKALQSLNLTAYGSNFSNLTVAENAFNSENLALSGILYVKDADAKAALETAIQAEDTKLPGFKNFEVVSVLDAAQTFTLVTEPAKKQYALGEALDTKGMELQVTLQDGTNFPVPENLCEITGFDAMRAGEQTITVKLLTNNTQYPEGKEFTVQFAITVTPATPVIHMQPVGAAYALSELDAVKPLMVAADISDAGTLTWQWYFSTDATGEGATPIEGANTAEVLPTKEKSGYYFAMATNTDGYGTAATAVSVRTDIVQVVFGDYEARVGSRYYDTLEEALNAAQDGDTVTLIRDVTLGKNLTLNKTITLTGHTILRDASYGDLLFTVKGGTLTLTDITIDGGARWSETSQDSVLGRGTTNNGVSARQPMLMVSGGEVNVAGGATLQNNSNNSNNYGQSGGAVRVTGGKLRISGGMIRDNYCIPYGGAVLSTGGEVILESGAVLGNHGTSSGGVFCVDGSSAFTMTGGTIAGNRGGGNGGVVWLSNGTATFSGGSITGNASATGTIFINGGSGVVNIGEVTISGNTAGSVPGIHVNSGTLNLTAAPTLTDGIYLPNGKTIQVQCSLAGSQPIPVTLQSAGNDGTVLAATQSEAQAKAAAKVLTIANRDVYADGTNVCHRKRASFTVAKELPLTATVVASKPLELTYQARADIGTVQYAWYRCEDASGANAALIADQTGATFRMENCREGTYYFYCVATSDEAAGSLQSQVCTVTVTPFVPGSVAIEKFKALG